MTVIPSYLGSKPRGIAHDAGGFTNVSLRIGEVKAIVPPSDEASLTGKYNEYSVEVQHRDSNGPGTAVLYTGCLLANAFGNGSDRCHYTLRVDPQSSQSNQQDGVGVGAKVLLVCINGESTQATILSGVRDPETDQTKDSTDDGHHYFWSFNGLSQTVNKDGEYTLQFRGATNTDDTLADGVDKNKSGATLTFTKDGGVELFDGGGGEESIKFDLGNHLIQINTDSNDGIINMSSPAGGLWKTNKTLTFDADKVKVGSSDAAEALVLGTTYRDGESSMNSDLSDGFQDLATQATTIATSIDTIGGMLSSGGSSMSAGLPGNIAAGPQVAAAGAAMIELASTFTEMVQTLGKMLAAIKKFEAQADDYVSKHHTTES